MGSNTRFPLLAVVVGRTLSLLPQIEAYCLHLPRPRYFRDSRAGFQRNQLAEAASASFATRDALAYVRCMMRRRGYTSEYGRLLADWRQMSDLFLIPLQRRNESHHAPSRYFAPTLSFLPRMACGPRMIRTESAYRRSAWTLICRSMVHGAASKTWPSTLIDGSEVSIADAHREVSQWMSTYDVVDPHASALELLAKAMGYRSPQEMRNCRQASAAVDLDQEGWADLRRICELRAIQHVPVQYIVGEWDFCGLSLQLEPPNLIPRPETEELVAKVLQGIQRGKMAASQKIDKAAMVPDCTVSTSQMRASPHAFKFLDVGSGTGAIGLALLKSLPNAVCDAIDVQESAVRLSQRNARRTGVHARYHCRRADIAALQGTIASSTSSNNPETVTGDHSERNNLREYDFIVSNPPYIPQRDMADLPPDVAQHEDEIALDGGHDGLDVVRSILRVCPHLLRRGGPRRLWMEVDVTHPQALQKMLGLEPSSAAEGQTQACHSHGIIEFSWMRDLLQRPRFVMLKFGETSEP